MEPILSNPNEVRSTLRTSISVDKYVGTHIRVRRITLGTTARQLGQQIGASFQQMFNYERGKDKVSASTLYRIASALGEPVEFFFGNLISRHTSDGKFIEEPLVSEVAQLFCDHTQSQADALDLVRCYLRIRSVEKRRAVLHLVKVLGSESGEPRSDNSLATNGQPR